MAITDAYVKPSVGGPLDLTVGNILPEDWLDTTASNVLYLHNRNVVEMTNRTGSTLQTGDVVIYETGNDASCAFSVTADDHRVMGVVVDGPVLNLATARVVVRGRASVSVNGTTARGDRIATSTTAGQGKPSATPGADDFAVALAARTGAGLVECFIIGKPIGIERFTRAVSFASAITINATGSVFSAGADASSSLAVGSGGAAPTANRAAYLILNAPTGGSGVGNAAVLYYRNGAGWESGIDNTGSSGAKVSNTDFMWYSNSASAYRMSLSTAGLLTTAGGVYTSGAIRGASYVRVTGADGTGNDGTGHSVGLQIAAANVGSVYSYDRTAGVYRQMRVDGATVTLATSGTDRVTLDTSGNLGIGSSPSTGTSGMLAVRRDQNSAHHIISENYSTGASAYAGFKANSDGASGTHAVILASMGSSYSAPYAGKGLIQSNHANGLMIESSNAAGSIQFYVNGSQRAIITTSGYLGVGSGSDTASILHVRAAAGGVGTITLDDGRPYNGGQGAQVAFQSKYNSAGDYTTLAYVGATRESTADGNNASAVYIYTRANGGSLTERMRIDSSGNLIQAGGYHSIGSAGGTVPGTGTIRLTNDANIVAKNNVATGNITLLHLNTSNQVYIGHQAAVGTATNVYIQASSTIGISSTSGNGITVGSGLQVGFPTGGDLGSGNLNVSGNVYKNNSAYTNPDFIFELAFTGRVVKYANATWNHYQMMMGGSLWDIDRLRDYVEARHRFPMIVGWVPNGVFTDERAMGRDDVSLILHEQAYLYLFDHEDRIKALERRRSPWLRLWSAPPAEMAPAKALDLVAKTPVYSDGAEVGLAQSADPLLAPGGVEGQTQSAVAIAWAAIQELRDQLAQAQETISQQGSEIATLRGRKP